MSNLGPLFTQLRENPSLHVPGTEAYSRWKAEARAAVAPLFSGAAPTPQPFGPFGPLTLPYTRMGAIDSLDLFGLDELIIFAFYDANRARYRQAIDIGANLGLHSIIMAKCGFTVRAFEPDPRHFAILLSNLKANAITTVEPFQAAVSIRDGEAEFVRVLGNTTGSHLAGAKDSYGEKEVFPVTIRAVAPLFEWASFAKIDAEGHEKELLLATTRDHFNHLDIMVEIGSTANAAAVFNHFSALKVGMFPQKLGWGKATTASDLPTSHRDGSLFVTARPAMPWK
jgi:FkbM family methyltransferase